MKMEYKNTYVNIIGLNSLRQVFFIGVCMLLNACQSMGPIDASNVQLTEKEVLSGIKLLGHNVDLQKLPDDHVTTVDEQMKSFVHKNIDSSLTNKKKIEQLAEIISAQDKLGFTYNTSITQTAKQAFDRRLGNCLAFSYLFVGLARELGVDATYQEVVIPPVWVEGNNRLVYLSRHVNVKAHNRAEKYLVVDVDAIKSRWHFPMVHISDAEAESLYYNNKGVEFMNGGNVESAFLYLRKAIDLAPQQAAFWSNLGILYRRQGWLEYAEKSYLKALDLDYKNMTVMSNLRTLYEIGKNEEKAKYLANKVRLHQKKNPYFHYYLAQRSVGEAEYKLALKHIKRAISLNKYAAKFYTLQLTIYRELGQSAAAQKTQKILDEMKNDNTKS